MNFKLAVIGLLGTILIAQNNSAALSLLALAFTAFCLIMVKREG
jgi:hypothetical protein